MPYVAPLLPAEVAWEVTLPAPPSAAGTMDLRRVYLPLQDAVAIRADGERTPREGSAGVVALHRDSGTMLWKTTLPATLPPVVAAGTVLVATATHLHALSPLNGFPLWNVPLEAPLRAPMIVRGNLLVALADPGRVLAFDLGTRRILWTSDPSVADGVTMAADELAVYLTTRSGRITCVRLADGGVAWSRELQGVLSEAAVGHERVVVGSDTNALWALDRRSGRIEWHWQAGRIFGGDVIGAAITADHVYVASLDNIVRALNRGNGHQEWKQDLGTRPLFAPRAFHGAVLVVGLAPTISTFVGKTGAAVSTWAAPPDAELQGPPLIDEDLRPYRVATVVLTRDGRAMALRPTAMMFVEPPAAIPTGLPGRSLPLDRLFNAVSAPAAAPASR